MPNLKLKVWIVNAQDAEFNEVEQSVYAFKFGRKDLAESKALFHELKNNVYRGANYLSAMTFSQEQMKYQAVLSSVLKNGVEYKDLSKAEKKFYFDSVEAKFRHAFNETSDSTSAYQILVDKFDIPPTVVSSLINSLSSKLRDASKNLGKVSMPTFKEGYPIPVPVNPITFFSYKNSYYIRWAVRGAGKNNESILFKVILGPNAYRAGIDKLVQNICDTNDGKTAVSIKYDKLKNDIYVNVWQPDTQKDNPLDKGIVVGVDVGISVPVYMSLNKGWGRQFLGKGVIEKRKEFQARTRNLQKDLTLGINRGKGRSPINDKIAKLKNGESEFNKKFNENLAKDIVKFALKNKAGRIHMEFLEGFTQDETNGWVLRNWTFYQMQQMIERKAKEQGIEVAYIDPYHTSQTCSCCGHWEAGQRTDQKTFVCKNPECNFTKDDKGLDKPVNADYNASQNIAKSTKYVSSKEDCEYFKTDKVKKTKKALAS